MKFSTRVESEFLEVDNVEVTDSDKELAASISDNSLISWTKFVLTDSSPNANYQRIPKSEFPSLVRTGVNMPLKMAAGEIRDGHDGATPLGVITNLTVEGNQILALAALWSAERPADISYIKEKLAAKEPVSVSWELLYTDSVFAEGIEDIYGITLRAATVVGRPAYEDRTPVLAVAARSKKKKITTPRKWSQPYLEQLPDSAFLLIGRERGNEISRLFPYRDLSGNVDVSRLQKSLADTADSNLSENVLKGVRAKAKRLLLVIEEADASVHDESDTILEENTLNEIEELTGKVEALTNELAAEKTKLASAEEKVQTFEQLSEEVNSLREFKAKIVEAEERASKLLNIKTKFEEAGIEKDETYFDEKADVLLGLADESLDFMIQEMKSFSAKSDEDDDTEGAASKIPNLTSGANRVAKQDIVEALRNYEKKN